MTIPRAGITVALFAACINDLLFPETPKAVVSVLERMGCKVEFPLEQTCCGQMFTSNGYFDQALPVVRNHVEVFAPYDYVVGPSGSCIGAVRRQHPMLAEYAQDQQLADEVGQLVAKTYDFTELLVDVMEVTDVGAYFPHRVTYHPSCHSARVAKVGDRPYQLLNQVKGIDLVALEASDHCCGYGGTFSVENPEVSVAIGADKTRHVMATGAEYLIAGDNGCLMQIGGLLHRQNSGVRTIHIAEVLAHTESGAV